MKDKSKFLQRMSLRRIAFAALIATACYIGPLAAVIVGWSAPNDVSPGLVSLYQVPMVCPTAPQIGCGSHAKPILLALEQQPAVSEAWLNGSGTVMAVVWKSKAKSADRASALNTVSQNEGLDAQELQGAARDEALKGFLSGKGWYRGREVDRLSEQEAGIMAARLVRRIQARIPLSDEKAKALKPELEDLFKRRLTGKGNQDEANPQEAVLKVLKAHLDEKEIAVLEESLPRNLRPLPGEQ